MSGGSFEESEISSTTGSGSFSTRISSSDDEITEEPTTEEFRRSGELADEAAAALERHDYESALYAAYNAIKLYSRNIRAYEALACALAGTGQEKQALEIRLIVAYLVGQYGRTSGPFLQLLPDLFSEFGDSRSFLVCVKFIFRYARNDDVKRRFIAYLEKTYGNQLRASSQIAIRQYFAKSLSDISAALEAANDSTKALIYARAIQCGDDYDDLCLEFCKRNLKKTCVQRLLNLLYLKRKSDELALLLALKSAGIDDRVAQALSGVVSAYVVEHYDSIADFSDEYAALIFNYLEYLIEIAPKAAREALTSITSAFTAEPASQPVEIAGNIVAANECNKDGIARIWLLLARADFDLRDCTSASQILRQIMSNYQSIDIMVRARLLSADLLQFLGLHDNMDKVLISSARLAPARYEIAIAYAAPRIVERGYIFDFQYFYSTDAQNLQPLQDVRFRVRLGLHLLERDHETALELLYLPLLHTIASYIDDQAYITTLQQILAVAFRCNHCRKIFASATVHQDGYVQAGSMCTFEHIYDVRRMFQQAGMQQIIYNVADLLQNTTYHAEKCRNLRQLALLYLIRCNQKGPCAISLSDERSTQFQQMLLQRAKQLNYGRLIYADLRAALSRNVNDHNALFAFVEAVIQQNDPVLHQNAYKLVKRFYAYNPQSRDFRIAKLYLAMQKRTLSVKNAETALELYQQTHQPYFLYIRALFLARHSHTKAQANMQAELFECCQTLSDFLRVCGQISAREAAYAWYAVANLLLTELGQVSEAEHIYKLLLAKKRIGQYSEAFDPEPDVRLYLMCAHQLSLCYMYMGNQSASIMIRRRYFKTE